MRVYQLVREEDVSGVSGTGVIAEVVELHDGQCVISWFGQHHTLEVTPHLQDIIDIHGHEGKTKLNLVAEVDTN